MSELHLRANAKMNLFLEVLDKRPSGYHNMYWPPEQVVDFMKFVRDMLDKQGIYDLLLMLRAGCCRHICCSIRRANHLHRQIDMKKAI